MKKAITLFTFLLWCITGTIKAQTITTVLGPGLGNGSDATKAMVRPFHIVNHKGAIYIAEPEYSDVRRLGMDGSISTVAGYRSTSVLPVMGGKATATPLSYPADVAFDSKDNMYIVDNGLDVVFKVNPEGQISLFAGTDTFGYNGDNIPATAAMLHAPIALAVDKNDNVYIADKWNALIRKVDTAGIITRVAGWGGYIDSLPREGMPATAVSVFPDDMEFAPDGSLYFISANKYLAMVDTSGMYHEWHPIDTSAPGYYLYGCTTDPDGNIYYPFNGHIEKLDKAKNRSILPNRVPEAVGGLTVVDNNIYLSCFMGATAAGAIARLVADTVQIVAGGNDTVCYGVLATNIQIRSLGRVGSIDANGKIWFYNSGRIKLIEADGTLSRTQFGMLPSSFSPDKAGNMYVATGVKVVKISPDYQITVVAGTDSSGYSGDGGLATDAKLPGPGMGIALDKNGELLIGGRGRIRKVDHNGIITTIAGTGVYGNTGNDGPAASANISCMKLSTDHLGNIYFLNDSTIRKIDTNGIISIIAGPGVKGVPGWEGLATNAHLNMPWSVDMAVDTAGNIYFSTLDNNVAKIDANGIIHRVAGVDSGFFNGENGLADTTALWMPEGMFIDDSGRAYVVDMYNQRIRRISSAYRYPDAPDPADTSGNVVVYPNPASGAIRVKFYSKESSVRLQLFDMSGRRAASWKVMPAKNLVDESLAIPPLLPSGGYLLCVTLGGKNKVVKLEITH